MRTTSYPCAVAWARRSSSCAARLSGCRSIVDRRMYKATFMRHLLRATLPRDLGVLSVEGLHPPRRSLFPGGRHPVLLSVPVTRVKDDGALRTQRQGDSLSFVQPSE